MSEKNPTCIRVQPGGDNATVTDCTLMTTKESKRSFVEASAKNTKVISSKIIELPKIIVKHTKHHKLLLGIIVTFGVTVAAGVTVDWLIDADEEQVTTVMSLNQHGGITAGQVNVGRQDRILTPQLMEQMEEALSRNKNSDIKVYTTTQDAETKRFAKRITEYLLSRGYNQTVMPNEQRGYSHDDWPADVNIYPKKDGSFEIIVAAQK